MKKKVIFISIGALLVGFGLGALVFFLIFNSGKTKSVQNETLVDVVSQNGDAEQNNTGEVASEVKPADEKKNEKEDNKPSDDKKEDKTEKEADEASATPFEIHGKLSLDGPQLVDKNGDLFQIKGVSTHGLAWFPEYVNEEAFKTIRDDWGANCIRLAMYSAENNGYCTGGDKTNLKNLVNNGVSFATNLGMYVIIDWHVLGDHDPNTYKSEAISFFTEMSEKYANYDNVIYEICNEPNGGVNWSQVKSYAQEVIPVIKENNPDAVIIVGTPTWSQDVDKAVEDPITDFSNIMYALHFYADTHRDDLRNRMNNALAQGLPIFVSEFGICDASGSGANNYVEGEKWIHQLNRNKQSYCIWNLSNKNETSSLIASSCNKKSGWTEADLSDSGKWYVKMLGGNAGEGGSASSAGSSGSNSNAQQGGANAGEEPGGFVSASASKGTLSAVVINSGGWNDGTNNFSQFTVTLSADGGNVSDWKIDLIFTSDVTIDQSWSGNYSVNGKTVSISPVEYNKSIPNGSYCEIGLIVSTSGNAGIPSIVIK